MENYPGTVPFSDECIRIPDGKRVHIIPYSDILYIKAAGSYVAVHLRDPQRTLVTSRLLHQMEEDLPKRMFRRCHRSYIINKTMVRVYSPGEGGSFTLVNGEQIHISDSYRGALMAEMQMMGPG